jgi:hypothetical protein
VISAPVYVEAPDSLAPAMGALALFGALIVGFGCFVMLNVIMGVRPEFVTKLSGKLSEGKGMQYLMMVFGGAILFFVIGLIIGKMTTSKR